MFNKTLFAASLVGLALSASQPAFAKTSVVGYADLNLASKQGQSELDSRLRRAAKKVCDVTAPDLQRTEFAAAQRCFHQAYTQAKKARTGPVETAMATVR